MQFSSNATAHAAQNSANAPLTQPSPTRGEGKEGSESKKPRARELGIVIGKFPTGKLNAITDVAGVKVGQVTLSTSSTQTGVTVIIPNDNVWEKKVAFSMKENQSIIMIVFT